MKNITTTLVALAATTALSSAATIAWEAEDGVFTSLDSDMFSATTDATASNSSYIAADTRTSDGDALATYSLTVSVGGGDPYYFYARARVNGGALNDSMYDC